MAEKEEATHEERKLHDESMQSKNRELPAGEPMSADAQAKWDRITKDLHSWVDPNKIREVIEKGEPRIYWGTATTGKPHLGYFVPIYKISDYLAAGCHVTILFANLHGFLDNMKSSWELLNYRMQFYELIIKGMLEYIGVPLDRLRFVRGTDFQLSEKYTLDMYRMAATVTTEHTSKAGAEVVKQVANPLMSSLLYPILQALDEEYLGVDIQFGGVDQRKIFMFAREKLPLIGYRKRAYLMNPLIPGLGKSGKMSSSEPLSKVDFDDSGEEVESKIRKAYSIDGAVEGNGLLAITKYILFRRIEAEGRKLVVPRPPKYGGDMSFSTYEEVEAAFILPEDNPNKLFSSDLKKGVLSELLPMIAHMRKIVTEHQDLKEKAYPAEKVAASASKAPAKSVGKAPAAAQKKSGDEEACPSLLDIRVGEVIDVEPHPSSDTLYVEKINVGEAQPRQVVSGLAKHITIEEFKGKRVLVFCNLKASNFRGVKSEGMVLAASLDEKVEILLAPENSKPGDHIHFGDKPRNPADVIDPKKKNNVWNGETAKPHPLAKDMHVDSEGHAKWKDDILHVSGTPATAPTLRNAHIS